MPTCPGRATGRARRGWSGLRRWRRAPVRHSTARAWPAWIAAAARHTIPAPVAPPRSTLPAYVRRRPIASPIVDGTSIGTPPIGWHSSPSMSPSASPASAIACTPIVASMSMVVSPSVQRSGLRSATPVTAAHPRMELVIARVDHIPAPLSSAEEVPWEPAPPGVQRHFHPSTPGRQAGVVWADLVSGREPCRIPGRSPPRSPVGRFPPSSRAHRRSCRAAKQPAGTLGPVATTAQGTHRERGRLADRRPDD